MNNRGINQRMERMTMSGKSRAFAVAAVTAGVIGVWAPAAMASTSPSGDNAGVVNISHNQVPVQACNDNVPVNVLGVQVPVNHVTGAGNLLSPGSTSAAGQDTSCHQASSQANTTAGTGTTGTVTGASDAGSAAGTQHTSDPAGPINAPGRPSSSGDNAGLINISHNQVPLQACNDEVPVNVLGVQVPVYDVVAALGILAPVSGSTASQDTSCHQAAAQANG
jgi:hypothetical protein